MSKLQLAPVLAVSVLSFSTLAAAQEASSGGGGSSCPPGSWFCAQAPQQQAAPAGKAIESLDPLPDPESPPPAPKHHRSHAASASASDPPPPVAYEPPPVGEVERPETPPPYEYAPPPPFHSHVPPHEWGLNLHMEGATIGHGTQGNAGMGGFGAGLRFKPVPTLGVEADLDFVGGNDYNGNSRSETAFTINGLAFLNPQSVVQVYLLAGFGWSGAHVSNDMHGLDAGYSYFGGQAGAGLEFRLSRVLAFNADFRGFIRGRTDGGAQTQPEFVDAYGHSTNTSGGGLFTGGMTLYF